ncbi:Cytokinesis regulator (Byr4), putative [Penicillium digitatum]|uniref:Cytokinesis regulator (Byr4), putative n=3 Tax=Penicillium digitatum TaxID=36651 RepID=K9FTS9_PEND2|nr:Cytokinesis regulator (Byr4), putative [Penicillium digitatum Pd1]EKV13045.1 Cytokinesis regulator (Byr4), putative [Penicillium digitatum PHI26]EKV18738.1 Cytokinesis regulator (Byr4), putative [Penicillium digitatum Pd1]QQK42761.1 Cytokinesis regulator (Byr4), putative [Penicillium digitatum]
MESLPIHLRPGTDEPIECWDDDDDLQFSDDVHFRTASSAGSIKNSSFRPSGHRDSISSRRSARSDIDSNAGDEDWQVPLYDNDEFAKEDAIASAKTAGIPIPPDIPKSALIGGTIKRLSTRKTKKTFVDDWSEDVELPGPETQLQLRTPQETMFPDSLRHLSSAATSPVKFTASLSWDEEFSTRLKSTLGPLDTFQDDHNSLESRDIPALKAPTPRSSKKLNISNAGSGFYTEQEAEDDFNHDFELPANHQSLELSHRKANFYVSSPTLEDFDLEWSEGSIGVRLGGTTRDGCSVPSSSVSIASPSVSSCLTAESEDDGLDGIVIPDGPLDFSTSLQKRQTAQAENLKAEESQVDHIPSDADDFFSGLDVDNEKAFSFGKPALNPNLKCKTERPSSPTRRSATTLTFTSATGSPRTRIPRLSGHDRTHSTHLETVSESGAPLSKFRTSQSRLGHSSQSSTSSLPAPSANPTSQTPKLSGRRLLGSRNTREIAQGGESSPSLRRLKTKRSLPSIRGLGSAPSMTERPPVDRPLRLPSSRPKTPVDLPATDARLLVSKSQVPFMPAGVTESQPYHASVKGYRSSRRTNSDSSGRLLSPQGTISQLSRPTRNEPFRAGVGDISADSLGSSTKHTITRPTKRRNFGDGTELESFDDLSTSILAESKFVKPPTGRGAPRSVRARLSQSRNDPPHNESPPQSLTSQPTSKLRDPTPRFARDTNASRNAREQRIASMTINSKAREPNPLSTFNSNRKSQPVSRSPPASATIRSRKGKSNSKSTSKPHLIKPMGSGVQDAKSVRGMRYNPTNFRWEGNENLVQEFDVAPKSPKSAPALITNVGAMQNVQTVGGMVFDPHQMCWLRASFGAADEDDVFAGLDDLDDKITSSTTYGRHSGAIDQFPAVGDDASAGESSDEGPMTEEFDVGPEFIRRQRVEEDKWRRKVDKWVGFDRGDQDHENHWRWIIRDLVAFDHRGSA